MIRAHASLCVAAMAALGCGAPRAAQRATVLPEARGASAGPHLPVELHPAASRYVVLARRSRLDVYGGDVVTGEHRITVDRWRAYVDTDPVPTITLDADLTSVRGDLPLVTTVAKNTLLEVDKYPHAFLTATLGRTDGPAEEHAIDGVAEVHGVRRQLHFVGTLTEEGDAYRFKADFTMSRLAFDMHAGALEPFLRDEVRVVVDALATPERVVVEEL